MEQYVSYYESPLGLITLAASEEALIGLWFDKQKHFGATLKAPPKPQERHVFKLAKDVQYQNILGLNVLTLRI